MQAHLEDIHIYIYSSICTYVCLIMLWQHAYAMLQMFVGGSSMKFCKSNGNGVVT